jgi:hypothetical protein
MNDDLAILNEDDSTPTAPEVLDAEPAEEPVAAPETEAASPASPDPETPPEPIEVAYPDDEEEGVADETAGAPAETEPEPATEPALKGAAARLGTAALTKLMKDQPELAKLAEAQPRVKAQLYQMARRSQELGEYQELMPSLAVAREAQQAATTIANYDATYFGGDPGKFWDGLHEASGDTGAYERNVAFLHQIFLDRMEQHGLQDGNEALTQAVAAIRESLGWGPHSRTSPRSPASEGGGRATNDSQPLPLHIRQRLERAEQVEREFEQLRLRRSDEERQANQQFLDETAQEASRELRTFIEGTLANTRLSDYDKQNIARDFLEQVAKLADQDKVHAQALTELLGRGGPTLQTRQQMIARVKQWARQNGRDILEPILQRAGAGLKQRQAQREAVRRQQRPEPSSAGAPSAPRQPTARDLVRGAEAKLGRRLTDREILELA